MQSYGYRWCLYPTLMFGCLTFFVALAYFVNGPLTLVFGILPILALFGMFTYYRGMYLSRQLQDAVRDLKAFPPAVSIPELLDAVYISDPSVRAEVRDALVELLPLVQHSDELFFNGYHRTLLYELLVGRDKPLVLSALKALAVIGDRGTIVNVDPLADGDVKRAYLACDWEIQETAFECRKTILATLAGRRAYRTLLRPAISDTADEILLRVSHEMQDDVADRLLRESAPPENEC